MHVSHPTYQHRVATFVSYERRFSIGTGSDGLSTREFELALIDNNVYGGESTAQAKTCHMRHLDRGAFSPPPPTPVYARRHTMFSGPAPNAPPVTPATNDGEGGPVLAAVLDACTHNLQWGLWDQARLFGMPDVVEKFQTGPREATAFHLAKDREILLNALFTRPLNQSGILSTQPAFVMKLWSAYRLTATTISVSMASAALGYYAGFSVLPLAMQGLARLPWCKGERTNGEIVIYRPEKQSKIDWVTFVVSLLVGLWVVFLDPSHQVSYYTSDDCGAHMTERSVGAYLTTDARRNYDIDADWVLGWIVLVTAGFGLLGLRVAKALLGSPTTTELTRRADEARNTAPNNAAATNVILMLTVINLSLTASIVTIRGDKWFRSTQDETVAAQTPHAEWLGHECEIFVYIGLVYGIAVGACAQRWAVMRFPDLVKVVWAAAVSAGLLAPIFLRIFIMEEEYSNGSLWGNDDETFTQALIVITNIVSFVSIVPVFFSLRVATDAVVKPSAPSPEEVAQLLNASREQGPSPKVSPDLGLKSGEACGRPIASFGGFARLPMLKMQV